MAATVRAMPGLVALVREDGCIEAVSAQWETRLGPTSAAVQVGEQPLADALRSGIQEGTATLDGDALPAKWSARPVEEDGRKESSAWLVLLEPPGDPVGARYGDHLRQLYHVSTKPYAALDDLLRDVLRVGCEVLGMPVGAINTFQGSKCRYRAVVPADASIRAGDEMDSEHALCHYVREGDETVVYADLDQVPERHQHVAYRDRGVRAYLGVPLHVGGQLYGALFFADTTPHAPFGAHEIEFAELMARRIERAVEQERADHDIRAARQLLAHAQRLAHLGSWRWQTQTGAIEWSNELYHIFGLSPDQPVAFDAYFERIHPDDRALLQRRIEAARTLQQGYTLQHRVVWPTGEMRHVYCVAEVTDDEHGDVVVLGTVQDITERVQADEALRESEKRFRLIAENASDVVCLHAADGTYVYVSPSVRRTLGYEPEELLGKTPYEFIHPDDLERIRAEEHEALMQGDPSMSLLRTRRKDGSYLWVESLARPVFDAEGNVVHLRSSARDVTERVLAEQALARTNQALEQRNRELQDFAYVASHDLQEPLRKIRAFTDLLQQDNAEQLDEQGRHYLERIDDAADRMSRLISDLLTFSRVTTRGQPFYPVDLSKIVEEVMGDLEIALQEANGNLDVGPMPTIEADAMQMRQLFQNLIGNALKFSVAERVPHVQVSARQRTNGEGMSTVIEVSDNGIGFDEKYLDRIFTPFQRLHARQHYTGTGMGLAICRRIVERHQGQITARSKPGEGTTFIVTLPCVQPSPSELSMQP